MKNNMIRGSIQMLILLGMGPLLPCVGVTFMSEENGYSGATSMAGANDLTSGNRIVTGSGSIDYTCPCSI